MGDHRDDHYEGCDECNEDDEPELLLSRQRSISLPGPAHHGSSSFGQIPSLSDVQQSRTGWDKLSLYMMGLPPKHAADTERWRVRQT